MAELLIPILSAILIFTVIIFIGFVGHLKFSARCKTGSNQNTEPSEQPDLGVLNCRVQLTRQESDSSAFSVEICGSVHTPEDMHQATVRVLITDVTDGVSEARPVHSRPKQWQMQDSPVFCYDADLGKIPKQFTTLSDWMTVAQLNLDWLTFPRRGKRSLQFDTAILSCQSGQEIACARCTFNYENVTLGYIDLQENIQRTKVLAVAVAFAVSAADKKLYNCEIELIKNWARSNICYSGASNEAKRKLEKALNRTVSFFCEGNQLNTYKICKEIVEMAPVAVRYDILDLCLQVVQANGVATVGELELLKKLAGWLEVDAGRFRTMMCKALPIGMHEVKDAEVVLGVTSDMNRDEARQCLNEEYRKWNARVINLDPEVQAQADQMLNLITKTRVSTWGETA